MASAKLLRTDRCAGTLYKPRVVKAKSASLRSTRGQPMLRAVSEAATKADLPAQAVDLISLIKEAALTSKVPPGPLLESMLALEALKLPAEGWVDQIQAPGRKWRLVFTAGSKDSAAAAKKQPHKGGQYFPIPACQRFTKEGALFTNGIFLGPICHLTFSGPFAMKARRLEFDVVKMSIGLGPITLPFDIKKTSPLTDESSDKAERGKLPFFLYAYADEDIIVARGRGGGLAVWARTTAEWEAKTGVLQVYT